MTYKEKEELIRLCYSVICNFLVSISAKSSTVWHGFLVIPQIMNDFLIMFGEVVSYAAERILRYLSISMVFIFSSVAFSPFSCSYFCYWERTFSLKPQFIDTLRYNQLELLLGMYLFSWILTYYIFLMYIILIYLVENPSLVSIFFQSIFSLCSHPSRNFLVSNNYIVRNINLSRSFACTYLLFWKVIEDINTVAKFTFQNNK